MIVGATFVLALAASAPGEAASGEAAPAESADDNAEAGDGCGERAVCLSAGDVAMWPRAALRAGFEYQTPDPAVSFLGANDGFRLDQARIGLAFAFGQRLRAEIVGDAARLLPGSEPNDPVRRLTAGLVDAWLEWSPSSFFAIRAGQTRMPGDREGMTAQGAMIFASRSVAASGVEPGRGFAVRGLSTGRDLGVVVGTERATVGPIVLDYRLALGNGNGTGKTANDNKLPAAYARTGVGFQDLVSLALGGSWNPRTVGDVPNQQDETEITAFAELHAHLWRIDFLALGLARQQIFETALSVDDDDNRAALGFGATSWIVLDTPLLAELIGMRLGYRLSYFDPPVSLPDVSLLEHAFAVRLDPPSLPIPAGLVFDVTNVWEFDEAGLRALDNTRVFALVQIQL